MKKMKLWMMAAFMMWCGVMAVSACQSNSKAEAPITREESDKAFMAEIEKSPEFYAAMNKYLAESIGETNMALMEGIKKVFDPNMILNPGKVCYKVR